MKIYPSKAIPGIIIHLPETLADLKKIVEVHGEPLECQLLLAGGLCHSSKTVYYDPKDRHPWEVHHDIDGTVQKYTDKELLRYTNIGEGMSKRAFLVSIDKEKCKCKMTK